MDLKDYRPVRSLKGLIRVPAFIGQFGEALLSEYETARRGNENFELEEGMRGSNPFITGLVNYVFAQKGRKFRTLEPTDDILGKPFFIIKKLGASYTSLNALDVWLKEPKKVNRDLWERVHRLAEGTLGHSPKGTFRIQGFYAIPCESGGTYPIFYRVLIKPAKNFKVIDPSSMQEYDGRTNPLDLPTGTRFDSLDKNGMVIPAENGRFMKWTLENGLSRVCLTGDGDLDSSDDYLANSDGDGWVGVVDAKSSRQIFS